LFKLQGRGSILSKPSIGLLAGALALALATAGCGGDSGDSEGTTATRVSKAAFVERADAICIQTYNQVKAGYEAFVKEAGSEPFSTIEEIEDYADSVLIPARQEEVEELRDAGMPKGEEDQVEAILAAFEEGIEKAEESPRDAVTSPAGVFVKAAELAKSFGLAGCRY
jgi:hypothetical protein